MTILITFNKGDINYKDITYNWFDILMALLITVNKNIYVLPHLLILKVMSL